MVLFTSRQNNKKRDSGSQTGIITSWCEIDSSGNIKILQEFWGIHCVGKISSTACAGKKKSKIVVLTVPVFSKLMHNCC